MRGEHWGMLSLLAPLTCLDRFSVLFFMPPLVVLKITTSTCKRGTTIYPEKVKKIKRQEKNTKSAI